MNIRTKTRQYVVQMLYTWELSKNNIIDIQRQYLKNINIKQIDIKYFYESMQGIIKSCKKIDNIIHLHLNRKSQQISQIEKAILRLSLYELYERVDIPYKVSINESIELAKYFGAKNSHKFINGILDQIWNNMKDKNKTTISDYDK